MADAALPLDDDMEKRRYTYADYLDWDGPERFQILEGEIFMMASPTVNRQAVSMELAGQIRDFLRGKPCRVFAAPLDVRLFPREDQSDDTVVQPDILVVCDPARLGRNSVNGPPDLVVEINSPSNTTGEMFRKFQLYLEAGVREYWIVVPELKQVQVHVLEEGRYLSSLYHEDAPVPVTVLPPLSIDLKALWAEGEGSP
ncbi:MAG: Uma2 family endonuclease [Treponema sp.]|jgi:Uma2 family endonuclease|nr:Uma2 family endonuclease [Treponema sp.]